MAAIMDQQHLRDIMSGRSRTVGAALLRAGAWPVSKVYGLIAEVRRGMYRSGTLHSRAADAPVISVGNLTTGGTGKTPMVVWLVGQLRQMGRRPAALLRGYKASGGRSDEAEMLRQQTGAPVHADPDRVASAAAAVADGADVLVLDDGFQHLRLRRDLDIVLIDATCPLGYGHVLPRGLLRERPGALADADAVVITRSDLADAEALAELRERLGRLAPQASLHLVGHVPSAAIDGDGARLEPSALAGKRVCAFCGIGSPDAFVASLEALQADVTATVAFDDHAEYGPVEMARIAAAAEDAEILVTTAKDRVRIDDVSVLAKPLWTLEVELRITEGEDELLEKVRAALA